MAVDKHAPVLVNLGLNEGDGGHKVPQYVRVVRVVDVDLMPLHRLPALFDQSIALCKKTKGEAYVVQSDPPAHRGDDAVDPGGPERLSVLRAVYVAYPQIWDNFVHVRSRHLDILLSFTL